MAEEDKVDPESTSNLSPVRRPSRPSTTTEPLAPFQYQPLDHTIESIRLVQVLLDDDSDSVIRCTMRHAAISEDNYKCLSYTWLPNFPQHTIAVNGTAITIGHNLYQSLLAYRKHQMLGNLQGCPCHGYDTYSTTLPLWIDATCINQVDDIEKSHQVQQMGQVYEDADEVWIWLGRLDTDIMQVFDAADGMAQHIINLSSQPDPGRPKDVQDWLGTLAFKWTSLRNGLMAMFNLRCWIRTRIIQEILLAKDI